MLKLQKIIKSKLLLIISGTLLLPTAFATHNPCNNVTGDWNGKSELYLSNGSTCKYTTKASVYNDYHNGLVASVTIKSLSNNSACPKYESDYVNVYCKANWLHLESYLIDMSGPVNHKSSNATLVGHVFADSYGYSPAKLNIKK